MSAPIPIQPTTPPTLYSNNTSKIGTFTFTALVGSFTGSSMRVRFGNEGVDGTIDTVLELTSTSDPAAVAWDTGTGVLTLELSPAQMTTILAGVTGSDVKFYVTLIEAGGKTPLFANGVLRILPSAGAVA